MESGKDRPAETWDYGAGDVWYFRPNEGHMVQGLRPGCTYLAGVCIARTARRASTTPEQILHPESSSCRGQSAACIAANLVLA